MTKKEKIRMLLDLMKALKVKQEDMLEALEKDLSWEANILVEEKEQSGIEYKVKNLLRWIGGSAHLMGYQYLVTAITKVLEDESLIYGVTKRLYPNVAKEYNSTPSRVELAIRHFIQVCYREGNISHLREVFGNSTSKLTNAKFIATLTEYIRMNSIGE